MSKFLTGKDLEDKLTDIIWDAKDFIIIVSPFIKLDDYIKGVFEKVKTRHDIEFCLLFGKNEESKNRSISQEDFEYFKEFKNIRILYNKDLHAKHYCNENEGLITSLNLYDYSMINNVEYGVHFTRSMLSTDRLYQETDNFTYDLIHEKSDVIYIKTPQYSTKMFGLKKEYQESKIVYDISEDFFNSNRYEQKQLKEFDLETETILEKKFSIKPNREDSPSKKQKTNTRTRSVNSMLKGYCIRTGEKIPYNIDKPMSYEAWQVWYQYENYDYPENYCHETGERSKGRTSMRNPVLRSR